MRLYECCMHAKMLATVVGSVMKKYIPGKGVHECYFLHSLCFERRYIISLCMINFYVMSNFQAVVSEFLQRFVEVLCQCNVLQFHFVHDQLLSFVEMSESFRSLRTFFPNNTMIRTFSGWSYTESEPRIPNSNYCE